MWPEVDGQGPLHVGDVAMDATPTTSVADDGDGVRVEQLGRSTWRLVANVPGGRLVVLSGRDPVIFGADAADALLANA